MRKKFRKHLTSRAVSWYAWDMIVVNIENWPKGIEEHREPVGRIEMVMQRYDSLKDVGYWRVDFFGQDDQRLQTEFMSQPGSLGIWGLLDNVTGRFRAF